MARYKARAPLLVENQVIAVGEEFTSDLTPGASWFPLDAEAIAASTARFGSPPPTEYSQRHWDNATGARAHLRATPEDPRVTGSFDDPDGAAVVRN